MDVAWLAITLTALAAGARATRASERDSSITTASSDGTAAPARAPRGKGLACPAICLDCCKASKPAWHLFKARGADGFKCILRAKDMTTAVASVGGRGCSELKASSGVPSQAEMLCPLTDDEKQDGVAETLMECEKNLVHEYRKFLAGSCGVGNVVGTVIEKMYFEVTNTAGKGGVCKLKGDEFRRDGIFRLCRNSCRIPGEPCDGCMDKAQADLCSFLKGERISGRLSRFALSAWAGAAGKPPQARKFPLPSSRPRQLKKIELTGWPGRAVAFGTTPEDDFDIDLKNGAFMCMMQKLQALPLEDNLNEEGSNEYVSNLDELGLGKQSALSPRSPGELFEDYFGRLELYPQPLHFDVPGGELLTDRALELLAFQAIGAHRLELLPSRAGGQAAGLNPTAPTLPMDATPQLNDFLTGTSKPARFAVRLEGLFEDLPVRPSMARWGGNAVFSAAGRLLAIQYRGETLTAEQVAMDEVDVQDGEIGEGLRRRWEYFKFVFRSSLVSTVTTFDHLVSTHILISETLALATKEVLPPDHPVRLLVAPHIWKTISINFKAANNLFPKNMLVHRASPWGDGAFEDPQPGGVGLLWKRVPVLRHRAFPMIYATYKAWRSEITDMPELPLFEDGLLFYNAVQAHVHRTLLSAYPDGDSSLKDDHSVERFVYRFFSFADPASADFWPDHFRAAHREIQALEALLTECIFLVSGWHRHVGRVPDFFRDTRFAGTAWKEGESQPRPMHALLMMLLAATTNADLPKMGGDLGRIFEDWEGVPGAPDWLRFSDDLRSVQEIIELRNEERNSTGRLRFHQMEPKYIDWGVMV